MYDRRTLRRFVVLVASGGLLLQLVGCAAGLGPILLSVAESGLLNLLLGSVAP